MRQTGKQVEAKVKHATKEKQARTAAKVKVLKAERELEALSTVVANTQAVAEVVAEAAASRIDSQQSCGSVIDSQ